jgi:trans-aconitate methyltransferase
MHDSARQYVATVVAGQHYARVVEVGGRFVNGRVRDLISADEYISIDLEDGPDVDVVGDCREWSPPWLASLVVSAETLEHAPDPRGVVDACIGYLRPGGRLVVTCAGPGRAPHSGHDGGPVADSEHYANIEPTDLAEWMGEGCEAVRVEFHAIPHDVYGTGIKR